MFRRAGRRQGGAGDGAVSGDRAGAGAGRREAAAAAAGTGAVGHCTGWAEG